MITILDQFCNPGGNPFLTLHMGLLSHIVWEIDIQMICQNCPSICLFRNSLCFELFKIPSNGFLCDMIKMTQIIHQNLAVLLQSYQYSFSCLNCQHTFYTPSHLITELFFG